MIVQNLTFSKTISVNFGENSNVDDCAKANSSILMYTKDNYSLGKAWANRFRVIIRVK